MGQRFQKIGEKHENMLIFCHIGPISQFGHIFTFLAHFLKSLTIVSYIAGISNCFLNFSEKKKLKKSKKFFFLFNDPPYFQMKIGDRNIEVRGPIFGMWPTIIIYNGNLSETKWYLTKTLFQLPLGTHTSLDLSSQILVFNFSF